MRALSSLIVLNNPDLVLFVGEALVGNDAVDQLTKFAQRLKDLATGSNPHSIDGILLTKFDTIDDKVSTSGNRLVAGFTAWAWLELLCKLYTMLSSCDGAILRGMLPACVVPAMMQTADGILASFTVHHELIHSCLEIASHLDNSLLALPVAYMACTTWKGLCFCGLSRPSSESACDCRWALPCPWSTRVGPPSSLLAAARPIRTSSA